MHFQFACKLNLSISVSFDLLARTMLKEEANKLAPVWLSMDQLLIEKNEKNESEIYTQP